MSFKGNGVKSQTELVQTKLMKEKYDWCQRFACFRVINQAYLEDDLEKMEFAMNRYNLLNSDVLTSYKDSTKADWRLTNVMVRKLSRDLNDQKKLSSKQQGEINNVIAKTIKLEAKGEELGRRVEFLDLIPEIFPGMHQGELFDSSEIINACKIWNAWDKFPNDKISEEQFSDEVALIERDYELYKSIEKKEKLINVPSESSLRQLEKEIREHKEMRKSIGLDREVLSGEDKFTREILEEYLSEQEKSLSMNLDKETIKVLKSHVQYLRQQIQEKEILSYKLKHFHQLSRLAHLLKMQMDVDALELEKSRAKYDEIEKPQDNYRPSFFKPEGDDSKNVKKKLRERILDLEERLDAWDHGVSYAQVLGIVDFDEEYMIKHGDLYFDEITTCLEVMEEKLFLMEEDSSLMEEEVILKNTDKRDAILENTAIKEGLDGLLEADGSQFSVHLRSASP